MNNKPEMTQETFNEWICKNEQECDWPLGASEMLKEIRIHSRVAFRDNNIHTLATTSLLISACDLSETTMRRGIRWLEDNSLIKTHNIRGKKHYSPTRV